MCSPRPPSDGVAAIVARLYRNLTEISARRDFDPLRGAVVDQRRIQGARDDRMPNQRPLRLHGTEVGPVLDSPARWQTDPGKVQKRAI